MTKTAIIILCVDEILIWAIPPLSPQQSDLHDFLRVDCNSTHILPLFKIPLPDDIVPHSHEILGRATLSSWYFGSGFLESVYFDFFFTSKIVKFKIIIKPDLSDASLHIINTSECITDDIIKSVAQFSYCKYKICEDALVYLQNLSSRNYKTSGECDGFILTSAPSYVLMRWKGPVQSLCPSSGRFVYWPHRRSRIVVVDLF